MENQEPVAGKRIDPEDQRRSSRWDFQEGWSPLAPGASKGKERLCYAYSIERWEPENERLYEGYRRKDGTAVLLVSV